LATKNAEKPRPCRTRTTPSIGTPVATNARNEERTTSTVPRIMKGRRPSASTQGPMSGWQTIPIAL
jgi:hypothetical protein